MQVPCNHCTECNEQTQNDWYVRTRYEITNTIRHGGSVWFPTLTYNDSWKPTYRGILSHNPELPNEIDCFDRRHVQIFVKKLRVYYKRYFYDLFRKGFLSRSGKKHLSNDERKICTRRAFDKIAGIKYFIACEYGCDPRYTQRPHYHCLLFLPFLDNQKHVLEILNKSWKYGFVSFSRKGGQLKSSACAKYVTKYVTKDLGFYKKYDTNKILDYLGLYGDEYVKAFKRVLPFHLQSLGYGSSMLTDEGYLLPNYEVSDSFVNNKVTFKSDGWTDDSYYTIPSYIKNKVLYNIQDGVRFPSSYAHNYFSKLFDLSLNNTINKLKKITSYDYVKSLPLQSIQKYGFDSFQSYYDTLMEHYNKCSLDYDDISRYILAYRNVHVENFDNIDIYSLLGSAKSRFIDFHLNGLELDELLEDKFSIICPDEYRYSNHHLYNDFPFFKYLENFLKLLESVENDYKELRQQANLIAQKKLRFTKQSDNYKYYKHI